MHEIVARRLHSQQIAGTEPSKPSSVVHWMGAQQAQKYAAALWAVGLRCGATAATVQRSIAAGDFLRTWLLRGTLHFVAAADVRWMLELVGPRLIAASARRCRQLGLDEASLVRGRDAFVAALRGGGILTRTEMLSVADDAGVSTEGQRGYHLLRWAGLVGAICFGPMQDKQETFVLLEDWAPLHEGPAGEKALAELAVRYFRSHGPATLQDFVWWSGLRVREARTGIERADSRLKQAPYGDRQFWYAGEDDLALESSPSAHLLSAFDEYYLGYRDRSAVLDPAFESRAVSNNGVFRPVIVVDGQIAGIWSQAHKRDSVTISLDLFRVLTAHEEQAITAAAEQVGMFLGKTSTMM